MHQLKLICPKYLPPISQYMKFEQWIAITLNKPIKNLWIEIEQRPQILN